MSEGDLVRLGCRSGTIQALCADLEGFGAVGGEPEWLVSAVWLGTGDADYFATSATEVLADGYVARRLVIDRADDFVRQLRSEIPEVQARLASRASTTELPEAARPARPGETHSWPASSYSTDVLIRVGTHASATHRVGCGLLFTLADRRLLVGTDPRTLAMVLSDDGGLVDSYLAQCESLPAAEYLRRYSS